LHCRRLHSDCPLRTHHLPVTPIHSVFRFHSSRIYHPWIATSCVHRHHLCMCIDRATGLGVGVVGSSFSGNLHPTPCIEWMQGKRGDPGCMAKAWVHPLHKCPLIAHRFRLLLPSSTRSITISFSRSIFIYKYIYIYSYIYIHWSFRSTLHECSFV